MSPRRSISAHFFHMSQTTTDQPPSSTYIFDNQAWDEWRPQIREYAVIAALPCALYGIFVLLCGASIYSLVQLNNRARPTALVLSLALLALFSSTTIHTVTTFLVELEQIYSAFIDIGFLLWSHEDAEFIGGPQLTGGKRRFLYCAPTAALTINIILGDAIVCWRACVLWRGNKIVTGACITLLLITLGLGATDTKFACGDSGYIDGSPWQPDPHANGTGGLYQGFSYGVAATALSLGTNLFATVAVAVKAWQSRRSLKHYVVTGPRASQVEKVFSLLVESGMIYCALWVIVLAWQVGNYKGVLWEKGDNSFWDIVNVLMNCALVPLIAIYPAVIIVLVALNRSHFENGFMDTTENSVNRLPLRPVAVAVNTTVTTRCDRQSRGRCDRVLVIAKQDFQSGDGPDGSSTYTSEEQMLGGVV